jgi:D-2-hydroxyglutarate dehydrogenase
LDALIQDAMAKGFIQDGTIGHDLTQNEQLWQLREFISEAIAKEGQVLKFDISLPVPSFYIIVEEIRKKLSHLSCSVKGFGHLGDGNLHLNVVSKKLRDLDLDKLESFIYDWTARHGGSISAEHGIGIAKPKYLHLSKGANVILLMASLKAYFDKNGILNPYKLFPKF